MGASLFLNVAFALHGILAGMCIGLGLLIVWGPLQTLKDPETARDFYEAQWRSGDKPFPLLSLGTRSDPCI